MVSVAGRLVGKVTAHRGKRQEDFVHVPAVVAGILLLLRHHADDGVGKIIQIDRVAHWIASGKQLLGRIRAEKGHAPGFAHVVPVIETSHSDIEAANIAEGRIRTGHRERGIVEIAVYSNRILLKFRNRIFAVRRLRLHHRNILVFPVHDAPGMRAASLQAGAAVEDDHHVFAEISGLFLLAFAQALARRDHEHDRNDAPGDPEHGEEGAQLVRPQGSKNVDNKITHRHDTGLDASKERK